MVNSKDHLRFDSAVECLSDPLRRTLLFLDESIKERAHEIRLRTGKPVCIGCGDKTYFIGTDSSASGMVHSKCYILTREEMNECFRSVCHYSVHTHMHELRDGYISVKGGHRVGIAGTAVLEQGAISSVRDITSMNLRIAREVFGVGDTLIRRVFADGLCGVLIAGEPSSGKTTLLRDVARQVASGILGRCIKVCVVDERGELGAVWNGMVQNDLGLCCDLLSGYHKADGLLSAVRSLSPELLICDEVGKLEEIEAISSALNSGVHVMTSVHAGNMEQLMRRPQVKRLLETGAFSKIVLLHGANCPCQIKKIIDVGEQLYDQDNRNGFDILMRKSGWNFAGSTTIQTSPTP